MRKIISLAALVLAATSWAGATTLARVQTGQSSSQCSTNVIYCTYFGTGSLSASRLSLNQESIGCSTGSDGVTTCTAINPLGMNVSCTTNAPEIATAARSIHANSYISFRSNVLGTCTYLLVDNNSKYIP
jgi:hypothetical protein